MHRTLSVALAVGSLAIASLVVSTGCSHGSPAGPPAVASPSAVDPNAPSGAGSAADPNGGTATAQGTNVVTPARAEPAGGSPHDPAPGQAAPPAGEARVAQAGPDGRTAFGKLRAKVPAEWNSKSFTSTMRAGVFELGPSAELVVYYFGETGAGSVDDNIERWLGQLEQPDGKPTKSIAKIQKVQLAGQEATTVAATGRYHAAGMMGNADTEIANAAMLAAIVASPTGPYYFKLVGPKQTVDANAAKFRAMLTSLELAN